MADFDVDVLRNRLRVRVNAILQRLHSPSFDSDSHDTAFYRVENRLQLHQANLGYYSINESQIRAQITNKTVVIEGVFAIFCSLRANNNDDIPCVVFKLEYVMLTPSRKDDRSSISLQSERIRFHTFTPFLRMVTCLVSYLSTFCLFLLLC